MELDDIDKIAHWFSDPDDLSLFDRTSPIPVSLAAARGNWKEVLAGDRVRSNAFWYVVLSPSENIVAIGGLESINFFHGDAVVPMFVGKGMRGKGIGIRLLGLMLDLAFDRMRLIRVTTWYREDNLASQKILQASGFHEEGRLRHAWFNNGKHLDLVVAGLLREDWRKKREGLREGLGREVVVRFGPDSSQETSWPGK
jgi:ribosomal-protein-alanine N-acetyltransferase